MTKAVRVQTRNKRTTTRVREQKETKGNEHVGKRSIQHGLRDTNETLSNGAIGRVYTPMLLVTLDFRIFHLTTNQTLSVKDSVFQVGVEGILGGITNTTIMNAR